MTKNEETQISPVVFEPNAAQKKFAEYMGIGMSKEKARKALRITLERLWEWTLQPGYSEWLDSVLRASTQTQIGEVRKALYDAALSGDSAAADRFLKAYDPDYGKANGSHKNQQNNFYLNLVRDVAPQDEEPPTKPAKVKVV